MPNVVVSMLLARHGETPDNAHGLILGRRDPPLSTTGRDQSARLAARIATDGVAAIWCSPLLRARQTAVAVAGGPSPPLVVAHAGTIRAALIALGRKPPPERALAHGEAIPLRWPAPAAETAGTGSRPTG